MRLLDGRKTQGLVRSAPGLAAAKSVPQFFFHLTTAYDIQRHCGVDLVKKDFLGMPNSEGEPTQ